MRDSDDPVPAVIKVIGAGGGGSNAVDRMIERGLGGVAFIAVNTDVQDLNKNKPKKKLQIGTKLTGGRGAGGDPAIGEEAAKEDRELIQEAVRDAHMVFVTAGMGGGTGTGSAPIIAQAAREAGALTVGVVTKPFAYEGRYKMALAEEGIKKMREAVDSLIIIPNEQVLKMVERSTPFKQAFLMADEVLRQGVEGISEMITRVGEINIDFADVVAAMKGQRDALMGIGYGRGENRAIDAASSAIDNPLLEDTSINGATRLLVNVIGGEDLSMVEVNEIMNFVRTNADSNVRITHGVRIDPEMGDKIKVTVVATGFQTEEGKSTGGSFEVVKPRERDFIPYGEWETIRERSFLTHRNARDEDIDVPTVIRDKKLYVPETPETKAGREASGS
ncbi:MAG: cell division protein FtsZ [Treponema sp.]|nr:cell division protein FtsZ [Treponema sp.]